MRQATYRKYLDSPDWKVKATIAQLSFDDPVEIELRNRAGNTVAVALVDQADAHLCERRWHVMRQRNTSYAVRSTPRPNPKAVLLHRAVMRPPAGFEVDHLNGNGLDNRRSNLRVVTHAQNGQNRRSRMGPIGPIPICSTSRYRGVSWHVTNRRWQARAMLDGRQYHLGYFLDEEDAAAVVAAWRLQRMAFTVESRDVPVTGEKAA